MSGHKKLILGIASAMLCVSIVISAAASGQKKESTFSYDETETGIYEISSNRHTKYTDVVNAICTLTTDGFEEKMSGDILSLWYNSEQQSIRIVDKRSGYVWGCVDPDDNTGLNKKWISRANSLCYVSYFDKKNSLVNIGLSDGAFNTSFKWKNDVSSCRVNARRLGISFEFSIEIDGERLIFSINDKSIKESGKNKLASVSFVNFFGSVYEDTVPGYALVPDGSGALIRFKKAKNYNSGYVKNVYGDDPAIHSTDALNNLNGNRTDDYATDEYSLSLPLWGIVHGENQNGFLATIDSGDDFAQISVIPAGAESLSVKYTRAYATFDYRRMYEKRVSNSKTVSVPEEKLNIVNPKLTYTFVTGDNANYSGMARIYRQSLQDSEVLPENNTKHNDGSVLLNIIASEVKKGFLSNNVTRLTTADQAMEMLENLRNLGVLGQNVVFTGWTKGGYNGFDIGSLKFEGKVGKRSEIELLRDSVIQNGGKFSLALDIINANKDQLNINREAALNATTDIIKNTIPNNTLMYPDTYFLRHSLVMKNLKAVQSKLSDFDVLYENLAKYSYSDYTIGHEIKRNDARKQLVELLKKSKNNIMLDYTNLYALKFASGIVNVPVSSSQYSYETDSVPFLQMILRGSVDYYSSYSNQGLYSDQSVLKMIEYGAYPSFMIMYADNFELYNTPLENLFSLNFENWKQRIESIYKRVNGALIPTEGSAIIGHTVVSNGVYRVEYENGCVIWINYTDTDFACSDGSVNANDYLVKEG